MKVIQICNVFYPAPLFGTEIVVYKIAKRTLERGYQSVVITSDLESFAPIKRLNVRTVEIYEGIRIVRCRAHEFPKVFPTIVPSIMRILRREVKSSKNQLIIHSHTYLSLSSFFSAVVRMFGSKTKLVHQPHYHPFPGGTLKGYFARRICDLSIGNFILNNSDAIVVMSMAEMNMIKQYNQINNGKLKIIPHGVDKKNDISDESIFLFREKHGIKNDDIVLLCVSRIGERVVDFFISLLPFLNKKIKVLMIGSFWGKVDKRKIDRMIETSNLAGRIIFTGYIAKEELPSAYLSSDIFVKPAYFFEAFGIVFMEAMSYGLPIITHEIGAIPEIVENTENGFVVTHSNNEIIDFKEKIDLLLENETLYRRISHSNKEKAKKYLWDDILDRYFELYEELLRESG